ncbi:hypothetical protein KP79_PYT25361 [Mizuhopecten yessoensis]|uniref:EGF-like domain-containing protein n=1 Tax=Mizuhopecten yessoensis TaxID=6573 RepID=A0A210R1I6_MIZYE|nr:hypothetical protein KP79_PYT25361 [Mizuhopecten yessoensis]
MSLNDTTEKRENMAVLSVRGRSDVGRPIKRTSCIRNSLTLNNSKVTLCVIIMLLNLFVQDVQAVPCRSGCRNNGMMIVPTSLFGYCRCVCLGPYAGPACEYKTKRRIKIRKLVKIKGTLRELIQRRMEQKE